MFRIPTTTGFRRLLAVLGWLAIAHGASVAGDDSLVPVEIDQNVESTAVPTKADPIAQELGLQRAIAKSLTGDSESAIAELDAVEEVDGATMFAKAMLLMKEAKVSQGVSVLETLRTMPDAPRETEKFLAIGYLHLGQTTESERAIEAYLNTNQDDAYAHYVRGIAMLRQDETKGATEALRQAGYDEEAVAEIRQVVMQFPVDVQARRSTISNTLGTARQLNDSRLLPEDKYYNFTFLIAGEYDSNVPLQPQFNGLGSGLFDYEDYRFLMASFLDVQLLTCDLFNLGIVGSTYNTFQFDSGRFDIQDYMGGAYANGVLMDDLIGSIRYEYHHTLVQKSRFADDHRLTPSLTWLGSRGHTTLFYEYNPINADAPFLIPAQRQSADIHRIGLTQAVYTFGGDGRIYAGYQYANALADGSDFDRSTNMVTGRLEQPLRWNCIADLDVRYVWDDYDNPNSLDFFGRPRDDNRIEVRAGLQKNFAAPVSLRLDYTYIDNDSNTENLFGVRFYDYDRHIFSTQLIFTL